MIFHNQYMLFLVVVFFTFYSFLYKIIFLLSKVFSNNKSVWENLKEKVIFQFKKIRPLSVTLPFRNIIKQKNGFKNLDDKSSG